MRGSLAWSIASRVWLGLASFFVIFNVLLLLQQRSEIRRQSRALLAETNLYLSMRFHGASTRIAETLEGIDIRTQSADFDQGITSNDFAELKAILPFSQIRILKKDASAADNAWLINAKPFLMPMQHNGRSQPGSPQQLRTTITYVLDPNKNQSLICFGRRSLYSDDPSAKATTPSLISACWTAKNFERYVDYDRILQNLSQTSIGSSIFKLNANSSLSGSQGLFLLAGSNGNIYLPASQQLVETKENVLVSLLEGHAQHYPSDEWQKLSQYMIGFHAKPIGSSQFDQIRIHGKDYLIQSLRLGPHWSSAILLPASTAYNNARKHILILFLQQLAALFLVTGIIFSTSKLVAQPISKAIAAIKKLSIGETSFDLPDNVRGELQLLYDSIRQTSAALQLLVADKLSNALRNQQLSTARDIQKTFLPAGLLESDTYSVAASFVPAYEVGADWFDIIEVDGLIFVVVADVCDKGVPSALFMSVFRSLLRFTLEDDCAGSHLDIDAILRDALERVNVYMAEKHGVQAMFATVFLGAFNPRTMLLHYVSAGHEPAQLLTDETIHELKGTNAAIGIFPNATYVSHAVPVHEGDILFAYTDGLTDAINAQDERWGKEPLQRILRTMPGTMNADLIIKAVQSEVNQFIGGCDQFDDLTLLALVVKTSAKPVDPPPAQTPA